MDNARDRPNASSKTTHSCFFPLPAFVKWSRLRRSEILAQRLPRFQALTAYRAHGEARGVGRPELRWQQLGTANKRTHGFLGHLQEQRPP